MLFFFLCGFLDKLSEQFTVLVISFKVIYCCSDNTDIVVININVLITLAVNVICLRYVYLFNEFIYKLGRQSSWAGNTLNSLNELLNT